MELEFELRASNLQIGTLLLEPHLQHRNGFFSMKKDGTEVNKKVETLT
jgi:hypothetical protein